MSLIEKIISGGQTGSDQGGLRAAKLLGIATGGTMPRGFKTMTGPDPQLAAEFGLVEHSSESYIPRTALNVRMSDGTIRIASDFASPGERCTIRYIRQYKKPFIDVDINNPVDPQVVRDWILANSIKTLNVAGNSEQRSPGIENYAIQYLMVVFGDEELRITLSEKALFDAKEVLLRNHTGQYVAYACGLFLGANRDFDRLVEKLRGKAVCHPVLIEQISEDLFNNYKRPDLKISSTIFSHLPKAKK